MPDRLTLLITANEHVYLGIAYMHSAPRAVSSTSGIYRCGMRNVENTMFIIFFILTTVRNLIIFASKKLHNGTCSSWISTDSCTGTRKAITGLFGSQNSLANISIFKSSSQFSCFMYLQIPRITDLLVYMDLSIC